MKKQSAWKWVLLIAVLPLLWMLFAKLHAFITLVAILLANSGASYLKRFTAAAPIDIEFLAVGSAYLAAYFGLGYAALLVLIGPALGEYVQGGISEFLWVKMVSIAVIALIAALVGTAPGALFAAVLAGLFVQYAFMFMLTHEAVLNAMRRITNAMLSAYIIFFIIPALA